MSYIIHINYKGHISHMNYISFFATYKDESFENYKKKQSNNTRVLKVRNNSLKLEKDFKPIKISINDTDK